jgi:hypothetical protein
MLVLVALFITGTAIGCWVEFRLQTSDSVGMLALPGIFLSSCLSIGPHGATRLYLWAWPLCNGVAYAGPVALAFWLRSKISK